MCCFRGLLELTNFHEGFREALPYWLNQAFSKTQDRVERAVQVDQVTLELDALLSSWRTFHHSVCVRPLSSSRCRSVQCQSNTAPQLWTWWRVSSLSASCGSSCPGPTLRRPSCSWSNSPRYSDGCCAGEITWTWE